MSKKDFFKGALFGALIGTITALLTASRTGKQTRVKIKKISADLSKKILKEIENIKGLNREKYEEIVERFVKNYGKKKRVAASMLEAVIDDLKDKWTEIKRSSRE